MSALPSRRPVRRLERLLRGVDQLPAAGFDVEDLEPAADVVAVRHERVRGGAHQAHVAEGRALDHVGVVRAEEETHVHLVAERPARATCVVRNGSPKRATDIVKRAALPLELHHVGARHVRAHLLRSGPLRAAELQRGEAVAVDGGVGVGRVGVQARADDHARLAVRVGALAQEREPRLEDEVALQLLPGEVELVAWTPHVHAGCGEGVFLRGRVVAGRAGELRRTDVAVLLEVAERAAPRAALCADGARPREECERERGPRQPACCGA